jgi:catechol 2,3-dioxygenase-like lactoylglutathione lyase family enzyme
MMKNLPAGVTFYRDGLGLPLLRSSDAMAEFQTGGE